MLKSDIKIKKKSKAVIPLIIAAAAVWGIIIIRVMEYYSGVDNETQLIINDDNLILNANDMNDGADRSYIAKPLIRDPFTKQKIKINEAGPDNEQQVQKIESPPPAQEIEYRITGTIINSGSRMVILEDITNNSTEFLREGDEYKDIKILKIDYNRVELKENGKKKTADIK